jgi:glycosyltransferase involved in cell wall biosynthesis
MPELESEPYCGPADVCILMATYNGSKYLKCQIESIRSQTYQNWQLLIRDDGSVDGTNILIDSYCKIDHRIRQLPRDDTRQLGAKLSFNKLLSTGLELDSSYFFFCDQDDYWPPTRLSSYLDELKKAEGPCLVYGDFELVDSNLSNLSEQAAFQAKEIGSLIHIDEPLTKYRQHMLNTIGTTTLTKLIFDIRNWCNLWRNGNIELHQSMSQASLLSARLENSELEVQLAIDKLNLYGSIASMNIVNRIGTARRMELRKGRGLVRLILIMRLVFMPRFKERNTVEA